MRPPLKVQGVTKDLPGRQQDVQASLRCSGRAVMPQHPQLPRVRAA